MQIFILHTDPVKAARALCDKHVSKQNLENAQMASTVFRMLAPDGDALADELQLYRASHTHHACVQWLRASSSNFAWFLHHAQAVHREYTRRYGKTHASWRVTQAVWDALHEMHFESDELTVPRAAISNPAFAPREPSWAGVVDAYRRYYVFEKQHFAKWSEPKGKKRARVEPPEWYARGLEHWERAAAVPAKRWKEGLE